MSEKPDVSIIVDFYNESGNIVFCTNPEIETQEVMTLLGLAVNLMLEQEPKVMEVNDMEDMKNIGKALAEDNKGLRRVK